MVDEHKGCISKYGEEGGANGMKVRKKKKNIKLNIRFMASGKCNKNNHGPHCINIDQP